MALPLTLNTNEVKNAAGTEEEFDTLFGDIGNRTKTWNRVNETQAYPHRITISHSETSPGLLTGRRRSVVRIDKTVAGQVDALQKMRGSVYIVADLPVGQMTSNALIQDLVANLLSLCATTGAGTTVLFDGTGNGAKALIGGGL
jgi:hypothetical protein